MKENNNFKKLMIFTIMATMCLSALALLPTASAATITVPGDYGTIQAAIDNANPGDTIMVSAGTYTEDLTIDKDVTLQGANAGIPGDGTRGSESIIDGFITVTGDGATIDGFAIESTFTSGGVIFVDITANDVTFQNNVQTISTPLDCGGSTAVRMLGENGLIDSNWFEWTGCLKDRGDSFVFVDDGSDGTVVSNNDIIGARLITDLAATDTVTFDSNTITYDTSGWGCTDIIFVGGPAPFDGTLIMNGNTANGQPFSHSVRRSSTLHFFIDFNDATDFACNNAGIVINELSNGHFIVVECLLIQDAIDIANDGDTIEVLAGTYNENKITIPKPLNLIGEDKSTTIIDAEGNQYGFYVTSDSVEITGFTVTNFTSHAVDFQDGSNSKISHNIFNPGIPALSAIQAFSSVSNVEVTNNELYGVGVAAYMGSCNNWNISNNLIDMQNTAHMGICGGGANYIIEYNEVKNCGDPSDGGNHQAIDTYQFGSATDWLIRYNDIFNNEDGIEIEGTGHQIHYNNIYNNQNKGVKCDNLIDATCNWWGDITGPAHTSNPGGTGDNVSDNVTFLPWLDDAYPAGDCVGGTCYDPIWVDDDAANSWYDWDHVESIQTAIDRLCDGGTIYVAEGSYNQSMHIYKPLSLIGDGATQTIVNGSATTGGTKIRIEAYGDVTIDGFTIDASESSSWTTVIGFDAVALPDDNPGLWTFTNNIFELGTIYFDHTDADIKISNNVFNTAWEAVGTEECRGAMEIGYNEMTFDNVYSWNCPGLLKFTNYPKYWENSSGPFLIPNNVTAKQWIHNNTMNCNGGIGIVFNSHTEAENWETWGGPQFIDEAAVFSNIIIENNEITDVGDLNYDGAWGPPVYPNVGIMLKRYGTGTGFDNTIISSNILNPDPLATENNQGIILSGNCSDTMITQNNFNDFNTAVYINSTNDEYSSDTSVHYNNFEGNSYGVLTESDMEITDATCNWWGDISGPSGEGPGIGDSVSEFVDYCPWLTDSYPAGDCTGGAICRNVDTGEYFCSIQAAIDDPDTNDNPGDHDTIEVFAVTTIEQVNVYKSVTIYGQGTGSTIIQSPDTLTDYFTTSNDNYPIVYVDNVDDVVIHNLTVDGAGKGNGNYRFIGIALYQAGGMLKDLEVLNVQDTPFSGAQHGTGIYAWVDGMGSSYDVVVQDCVVEDFQKNGITLSGSDLTVDVIGCTVNGKGPTDVTAQNGIQVSHGASGSITESTVSGCSYVGDNWAASGILPYFADGVLEISDNVISENQANIYLGACSADITDNTITATAAGTQQDYFYGIIGDPGDPPIIPDASPFDDGTPPVDRATYEIVCSGNDVIGDGSSSSTGIGVYAGMYGTYDIEFTATNNNVKDWGFGFELYAYGSNDLIFADINYNNIVGNDYGIYNWLTTTFDCTCNWYGDALGPTHSSNPYGSGDVVSDYVDFLPWLNLPFDDSNSECGAGICQDEVWVDDDFTTSTPGWYVDHFPTVQVALDRLNPDGTAWIADGIYDEDLVIDDDNCGNEGILIKGAYECFPTDETAIIQGSMQISVDDVMVKYLEFTPRTDAAVMVSDGVSGTVLECNKFRRDCVADAVGIIAEGTSLVTAELNWWGAADGPDGGLMDDGVAAGFGVDVVGDVLVEPWVGVHAEISEPVGTVEIEVGSAVSFDATGSFAYSFGECCVPTSLHKQFLWDFDDGLQSANVKASHVFDQPGTYEVSLMVDALGIPGLYGNFMYDWDYVTVHVVEPGTPLTVNADGENLGGYETRVGEPVQLFGDAFGGEGLYYWSWSFGDGSGSSDVQNPVHTYDAPGVYTVELSVTSGGETASDTAEVLVRDVDELVVDLADGSGVVGEELLFAASVSGGSGPFEYDWSFGDGLTSTMQRPVHVYSSAGEYTVTVTVTDSNGQEKSALSTMIVDEQTDVEPVEISGVSGGMFLTADVASGSNPVEWSISVDGSVFVGGNGNGQLPARVTEQIKLPLTFGFGSVDITISANDVAKEYTAFLFGPLFLDVQER